ncbi:pilus assembly PilX N-terminal domain-containing protein [Carboxydochorda subterranea]|uniref:Pilus assembly PilX N-terminal domain-containing protein n=1 Tax=Carboxydichorda subterranea TaxID=3109565 RepID=A0ABZ1BUN1_9FIRM|nr:pilus assembly PilX N-terminal domain-containing protein [Limnochorda sp. L945t]WRP16358.1 pilus assembly PilX N-terminal domain-containing protein [Limnochorda sp. L945t]
MALILTTAVMVMASGLALVSTASLRAARHALDRARALYAAESGMNVAIHAVETDAIGNDPWTAEVPGWYRVTVNGKDGERCPDIARTVYADGWSGSVHRRFSARLRLTTTPFPREKVVTAGCEADYFDPLLTFKPIDQISPPHGWTRWPGGSVTVPAGSHVDYRVDGPLYLGPGTTVTVSPDAAMNLFINGDLFVDDGVTLNVSAGAKVNFYTYGSIHLGANTLGSTVLGSKLNVNTSEYVVFHVQQALTTSPGSAIVVTRPEGDETGGVVFVMSNEGSGPATIYPYTSIIQMILDTLTNALKEAFPEFSIDLCKLFRPLCSPPSQMAVYAPTRWITGVSLPWSDPKVKGSLVGQAITDQCNSFTVKVLIFTWTLGCGDSYGMDVYADPTFKKFPFTNPSRMISGSWKEVQVVP